MKYQNAERSLLFCEFYYFPPHTRDFNRVRLHFVQYREIYQSDLVSIHMCIFYFSC